MKMRLPVIVFLLMLPILSFSVEDMNSEEVLIEEDKELTDENFENPIDKEKRRIRPEPKKNEDQYHNPAHDSGSAVLQKDTPQEEKINTLSIITGIGFLGWGVYDGLSRFNAAVDYNDSVDECEENDLNDLVDCDPGLGRLFYIGFAVDAGLILLSWFALFGSD